MKISKINSCYIIDDDPIFIYGTKRIMKEVHFCDTIVAYNNAEEALVQLKEISIDGINIPNVIFLDIHMPVMNGWQFLEEFQKIANKRLENIDFFVMSSKAEPGDYLKIKESSQIRSFIQKPLTPKDLEYVLEAMH